MLCHLYYCLKGTLVPSSWDHWNLFFNNNSFLYDKKSFNFIAEQRDLYNFVQNYSLLKSITFFPSQLLILTSCLMHNVSDPKFYWDVLPRTGQDVGFRV